MKVVAMMTSFNAKDFYFHVISPTVLWMDVVVVRVRTCALLVVWIKKINVRFIEKNLEMLLYYIFIYFVIIILSCLFRFVVFSVNMSLQMSVCVCVCVRLLRMVNTQPSDMCVDFCLCFFFVFFPLIVLALIN